MRHLYLAFVLAFAVMTFGFFPSATGALGPLDTMQTIHGVVAVLWMAMLVLQSWLIGHGYNRLHRWIGRSSLVVVPVLLCTAFQMVVNMLGPRSHFDVPLRLTLAWIDLWSLALFALVYVLALAYRRTMFLHARFMASTVFIAIVPALGRAYGMNIPGIGGLSGALPPSFLTVEIVLAALIIWDRLKERRWTSPWWVVLAGLAFVHATMFQAPGWPAFVAIAQALGLPEA